MNLEPQNNLLTNENINQQDDIPANDIPMSITEHLEELRQRTLFVFLFFLLTATLSFTQIKIIVAILQAPAIGIKFLQLAPGEYFFSSIKVAIYSGIVATTPFGVYQVILYVLPGLTGRERKIIIPILISSVLLFVIGGIFAYFILAPAALTFLISYGSDIVEPLWSFEQYFDFILLLLFSTGLAFEIPIIQLLLGVSGTLSSKQMIRAWRYIIIISTIAGAILTPSTDPVTQIIMSSAVLVLYFSGIVILLLLKK
uniref:sec-independent periplasmic protein translocase component C n=1 Tax=Pyropia dentata TaxID=76160 RepID=UPI00286BE511|nr:sec-independent periplasmic protein translocase component C [Neoporphyra dentata]WKD83812.1 sec-independent periplasmic protein translocase component C [Neoporphyra dentata]